MFSWRRFLVSGDNLSENTAFFAVALVKQVVKLLIVQDAVHNFIHYVREQVFIFSALHWVLVLDLCSKLSWKGRVTYKFGSLFESQKQEFLALSRSGVGLHALKFFFVVVVGIPFDRTLNFTFEMSWKSWRNQRHFDVLVRIRFQFSGHRLKFEIVATHQAWFLELEL